MDRIDPFRQGYVGHELQNRGVEEHRLVGGRGDGMRLFEVRNGLGLQFTVSADRCADLSRLSLDGVNFGFFSASGYVHPAYYDGAGKGSEGSFTGGFLATCGLENVGPPCVDEEEALPLHGRVGNLPAERVSWDMDAHSLWIQAVIPHGGFFGRKLRLTRRWTCSCEKNELVLTDTVENVGDKESPLMLLYHINLGYPLLSERSELFLPARETVPRDPRAAEGMEHWREIAPPQPNFQEQCYYHRFSTEGVAGLYNPTLEKGVLIRFDPRELPCLTQWKMLGFGEYVLGLEPGNCYPDGRAECRRQGLLDFLAPGETRSFTLHLTFPDSPAAWSAATAG